MTLAEAQSLDAGAWKGAEYVGQLVPSLADVFEIMAPSSQEAVVEIKDPAAAVGVVEVAREYSMSSRITALSDDPETLYRIESIDPTIRRALLCTAFPNDVKNAGSQTDWLIDRAHEVSANVVDIDYRFTSPQMILSLHRAGIEVWVWTVNAPEIMNCLIEWGIDGIASDRPDVLLSTVKNVL
jgi:glycerophosphoryl diester phosphodiesterase